MMRGLEWVLVIAAAMLSGCAGGGGSAPLDAAARAYEAGRYDEAFAEAERAASTGAGRARVQGQYYAGMSAFQLGRGAEAERYLRGLTEDADDSIAGHSSATLGLIALEGRRYAEAVERFRAASGRLEGNDRAWAAYHCGLAYQGLGQLSAARTQFVLARGSATEESLRNLAVAALGETGYVLQIGAFSSRSNAERKAMEFEGRFKERYGAATVVERREGAETLFLVQVGLFQSYESARRALQETRETGMVVPVGR